MKTLSKLFPSKCMCLLDIFRTKIEWFPGKSLTQKILKKKPKKGSNDTKPIIKTEECESFFHFFDPPQLPEDAEEIDEETVSDFVEYII